MPTIQMSGAQPWTNLYDQCCPRGSDAGQCAALLLGPPH
jgi:hypothetical protein